MRESTILASFAGALVDFAVTRGADRTRLLQRAGIDECELQDPTGRVPLLRYAALLDVAVELCNDDALPLRFGERVPMEDLSLVALVALNAGSVAECGAMVDRYAPLILDAGDHNGSLTRLVRRRSTAWIELTSPIYARYPRLTEAAVARAVCGCRRLLDSMRPLPEPRRFPEVI